MQVVVEETSALGRKVVIQVPVETVSAAEKQKIKELSKSVKMNGFRSGNVPENVIKKKFGKQAYKEVVSEILESSVKEALEDNDLRPVAMPSVDEINDNPNEDLKFTLNLEVFPNLDMNNFADLEVKKPAADISDEDIDTGISRLQEQFAAWEAKDGAAEEGDRVKIDFDGFIDGEPLENGSGKDHDLELGAKQFIEGFEDGLVGTSKGDSKELNLKFPENYGEASIAGKDVLFKVTIKEVEKKKLADLDEDFAKKIGLEDGDVEKIREKVKTNMEEYLGRVIETKVRDNVLDAIVAKYEIELPKTLVDRELENLKKESDSNKVEQTEEQAQEEANKRVKVSLILEHVISEHKLTPDEARVKEKLNEVISMLGGNFQLVQQVLNNSKDFYNNIRQQALADQATDFILEKSNVVEEKTTFKEITGESGE